MTLLGLAARSTFFKWKKDPNVVLPKDTLERIPISQASTRRFRFCCPTKKQPMSG